MESTIVETERLVLRPFMKGDEQALQKYADNDNIAKFMLFETPFTLEDAERWVNAGIENFGKESFCFFAQEKAGKGFVGWIKLDIESKKHKTGSVALFVAEPKQKQGFGKEMLKAVFDFGFKELELNRIEYHTLLGNKVSEALIKKLGGKFEGIARERFLKKQGFVDVKVFAMLKKEWLK